MLLTHIHDGAEFLKQVLEEQKMQITFVILSQASGEMNASVKVNSHILFIEHKSEITLQHVKKIENKQKSITEEGFLMAIANYISPKAKVLLKEKSINYLDKAGNIFLKLPDLAIYIEGYKNTSLLPQYRSRAFTKSGGAVVFQFLMEPDLVNAPQRQISAYAGVSLGTIPKVFEGLRHGGFLIKLDNKTKQLINYEKLLHKWIELLNDKILPAHYIQQYRVANSTTKKLLKAGILQEETQWGGEAAASLLTQHLIPGTYSLFTSNKSKLLTKYGIIPDQEGEISVYNKFWSHSSCKKAHVHPILVYGQLMADEDSRNRETAEIIYNEHIRSKL